MNVITIIELIKVSVLGWYNIHEVNKAYRMAIGDL